MKRVLFLLPIALLLVLPTLANAQNQTKDRLPANPEPSPTAESTRRRVVGPNKANHAEKQNPAFPTDQKSSAPPASNEPQAPKASDPATSSETRWGNTSVIIRPTASEKPQTLNNKVPAEAVSKPSTKLVQPTALISELKPTSTPQLSVSNNRTAVPLRAALATTVYQVGVGDVLDIQLGNLPTRESTLFTVLKNGVLEYPLLNGPISVAGLTTAEIANLLSSEIKVIRVARVSVTVRDYASHGVIISGLVESPGRKVLRREAMPLYAVLAEALPRAEATVATVLRNGKTETVTLSNEQQMSMLVMSGDVIRVSGDAVNAKGFVYIGGDVTSPGEKEFRDGMTLTQALISAGGAPRSGKTTVKVTRRNAGGFLTGSEFNVQSIQDGKTQDPLLQAGDRIEVIRGL